MNFPVDLLADVSQAELQRLAHNYMNDLLYSNPDSPERLTLSDSTQITINISSVGFIPLYGSSDKQRILALFSPSDPLTAVALYLLDQWWTVDDILKTADPARDGALEVETVGERIVLYILNRVIYRAKEMSSEEIPFLCHGEKDHAKILWNNGEAVGFYSVKPSGSLCNSFSNRSYQLPVMDSIFVRKSQRGKGFGLLMLEDFVLSYKDYCLGLRYPLSKSMYKVCEKYLCQYPGDTDLLWEVESIGGPKQRTKISSKIQTMDLSVFKRLSFTEESIMITEVTEKEMEEITTKIKETSSMECTVETVEEVTVLRATKEAELPVTARGRSSGSKRIQNIGENIAEDKPEKVIRIEDIEAETPREEQVPAQQKTEVHDVPKLVQTEGMFSVSPEENGDLREEAVMVSDKPATVLASQDLEEVDVTSVPMMEETQVVDTAQGLNNTSHDSQMTVENVASEIEGPEEECQKEDTTELVVSEEVLEVHKEAETVTKLGEETRIEVCDEKLEETVTQHESNLSTHITSEDSEAGKTGGTVIKAIKTVQSETPKRRSQRHIKPEEGLIEETTAQDGGRVLRRKTVMIKPTATPKRKYTRRSHKVYQELEEDVDEVAEDNEVSTTEVVEELRAPEGEEPEEISSTRQVVGVEELREDKQQPEEEQLTNEEETEEQEEALVEDTALKGISTELPDTADSALTKTNVDAIDESEEQQKGEEIETSEIQDKQEVSDDEVAEPPAFQRRSLRGKQTVTPEPESTKGSKGHQKQEEEHTDEADLEAGGFASEETPDEKATDKQIGEHHQVQPEETVDKTEETSTEELSAVQENTIVEEAAEDVIPSTELEECKEVQEDKNAETASVTEADKESVTEADKESVTEADKESVTEADKESVTEADKESVTEADKESVTEADKESVTEADKESVTEADKESVTEADKESVTEADKEQEANDMIQELDIVTAASETVMPDKVLDDAALPDAEKPQEKDTASETPKLLKATVILVDLKTSSHPQSVEEAEQTPSDGECAGKELMMASEENEVSNCDAEEQTPEPEITENSTEQSVDLEAETVEKEELEEDDSNKNKEECAAVEKGEGDSVLIEAKLLRSGKKIAKASSQQQEEDSVAEKVDEAETGTFEEDVTAITVPVEENQSAVLEICADLKADISAVDDTKENLILAEVDEEMSCEEEEASVETRALRSVTKIVTATPKHKTTRSRKQVDKQEAENSEEEPAVTTKRSGKQIQEEEQKGIEESKSVEETGEEEETVKRAAVENADKEREGENEEEMGDKEAVSQTEENIEPEINAEAGKAVAEEGQDVVEEQSEAISKTFEQREVETSSEECDETQPTMGDEEVEPSPVSVMRSSRSGGKTPKAGLGSAEEPPTEGGKGKAPEEDEIEVENEEPDTVEVDKGVSDKGPITMTKEEEKSAGLTAVTDDVVQEDTSLPKLAVLTPSEDEATVSAEEQCSKEIVPQLSDLQRVTVVLVDLKNSHRDIHKEMATVDQGVHVEKTAPEEEDEQREKRMKEEEQMAKKHVPGSPVDVEKTVLEKVAEDEEGFSDKVEDLVTMQDTGEERNEETAKEDEAESLDDEEEPTVTKTPQRSMRKAAKATPRGKLPKSRQKKDEKEKEETSDNGEEEPAIQVRVLRTGRKSYPVRQRRTIKTNKQVQEEEEGGEEQAEEQQQMIHQEEGERLEAKDATQQVRHHEPEMDREKVDAVILSEVQATSTETVADEDTEAPSGQLADDGKTSDDVADEAVTTQDTVEGEQSTSISEQALFLAKDEKEKGVSEEDEASIIETRLLRSCEKTVRATTKSKTTKTDEQDEEEAGEKSIEERRALRKGRRSAPATPRRKSKRARTRYQPEEEEESTPSDVEEPQTHENIEENDEEPIAAKEENTEPEEEESTPTEVEEPKADEKEDNCDEMMEEKDVEEPVVQKEENSQPEVEVPVGKSVEESPNEDEGKVTDEEEAPVLETRVLRTGGKTVKATPISKTSKSQEEENEQVGTVEEKISDTEEPAVETRALRKGRRSAATSPTRKSKRARTEAQADEEEEKDTTQAEEIQVEETIAEDTENNDEKMEENDGEEPIVQKDENIEPEVEMKKVEGLVEESVTEQETVEEEQSGVADTSAYVEETPVAEHAQEPPNTHEEKDAAEEEAQIVETRVLRRGRRSAAATARRKSRRTRTQYQPEEEEEGTPAEVEEPEVNEKEDSSDEIMEENNGEEPIVQKDENIEPEVEMNKVEGVVEESVTGQETVEEEQSDAEMKKKDKVEEMKDASIEEAAVLVKEDNSLADMDETDTDMVKAEGTNSAQDKETTVSEISTEVVSHTAFAEEEAIVADEPVATEETPAVTRTHPEKEKAQEPNDSSPENEEPNFKEQAETDETSPTEDNTEAKEITSSIDDRVVEPAASITRGKQLEESSNEENLDSNMGAVESTSEKGNVSNLVLDTDEEVETNVSSQEIEEVEQNTSDEEVEPIVIGKKVLRGRTVPSVIITPRTQSIRHSSKVQTLEESLSDEEENPVSAQKRGLRKRKSTGVTPARKSRRHSRV